MDTPKCIPSQLAAPTTSTNVPNISAPVPNSKDTSGIQVMAIPVAAMSQLSDSNGNNATTVASSSCLALVVFDFRFVLSFFYQVLFQ
ncbi:hypothetical protein BT69DRAFT_1235661, partial [Atractiella rhizophila]